MDCPKCGYAMSPFDEECPRCARLATQQEASEQPTREYPAVETPGPQPSQATTPVAEPIGRRQEQGTSWAIASLVLGALVFCSMGLTGPFAIWTGVSSNRRRENSGMAVAGIVLGVLGSIFMLAQGSAILVPVLARAHYRATTTSQPTRAVPVWPPQGAPESTGQPQRQQPATRTGVQVAVVDWTWRKRPDFGGDGALEYVGEVANTGNRQVGFVEVHVSFYDAQGNILTVDSTYCQPYNLNPGEHGLFKAWADYYPQAQTCQIRLTYK